MALDLLFLYSIIEKDTGKIAKEFNVGWKNEWCWERPRQKDGNVDFLSDYIKEVDLPGAVIILV